VQAGYDTAAMLAAARDGGMAVLSIVGANPALHYPDGELVREALAKVPFIVVSDLFMTETAELATLVLPAKGPFEKDGTTLNLAGDILPVNAAKSLESPQGVLSDLEMLVGLGEQLRVDLPMVENVEANVIGYAAKAGEFTVGDERFARTVVDGASTGSAALRQAQDDRVNAQDDSVNVQDDSLMVALQSRIFCGGGTSANDDRIAELRCLPEAAMSQADAEKIGVTTGDYIDLQARARTLHDLLVEVRGTMPRGVVALIDGLPDDPGNLFGEGARVRVTNIRRPSIPQGSSIPQNDTIVGTAR
jgi:anaerobic selenocysteine-containing dehydrogenase